MTKTDFYSKFGLVPDSGSVVTSWGAVQPGSGKYLLQCWNDEKTFIKKQDRTDDAVMIVKVLSPKDLVAASGGGPARARTVAAVRKGAIAFVAVSTGQYPDWIQSANLDQVYPVISLVDEGGDVVAKVGAPVPIEEALGAQAP